MSFQSYVTQRLAAITQMINAISTNAKNIDELPIQETLVANSKIHVSNNGNSESLKIQKIFDAFEEINQNTNELLSIGEIVISGNNLNIPSAQWRISGINYILSGPINLTIPFSGTGKSRIDILVANTLGQIIKISGSEAVGIALRPNIPVNTILVTEINVDDNSIADQEPPILGSSFLKKEYDKVQIFNGYGTAVVIRLNTTGRSHIRVIGGLTSISGISLQDINANYQNSEYPHQGKFISIQNKSGHSITLKNLDSTVEMPFVSIDGNDIVLPNNGIIFFKYNSVLLEEFFRNWKEQSLGGTQYSYVKGNGTPQENGIELQTAYNLAKTIVGLSATNRFKIIVGAGKYTVTGQFAIDTQYIDFVSLTVDADVEFTNGINITANNVYLRGLKTSLAFEIANNLNLLICDNCVGGGYSFGIYGVASGTFTNCIGGYASFGGFGEASGTFTNCFGGDYSFGSYGVASGTFTNCIGGYASFGGFGEASGTFTNCIGGYASFGGYGELLGKLFYCRLTDSSFETVSSGGRTYYCIDGNGDTNNQ